MQLKDDINILSIVSLAVSHVLLPLFLTCMTMKVQRNSSRRKHNLSPVSQDSVIVRNNLVLNLDLDQYLSFCICIF